MQKIKQFLLAVTALVKPTQFAVGAAAHVLVILCVHACVTSECFCDSWESKCITLLHMQVNRITSSAHFYGELRRRRAGGSSAKAAS